MLFHCSKFLEFICSTSAEEIRKAKRNWNTGQREDMPGKSLLSRSAIKVESSVACLA